MFLTIDRNYVEKEGEGLPERVALVTNVTLEYVSGFYWRYDTNKKTPFKIALGDFFARFVEAPERRTR